MLKEGANSEVCDALSLGLLKLEVPTGRGVKVHERTSVFSAALASAQCSPDPHPGNSLLKILSKVQTPASELDLFASLSTFFFPAREDHYQLLCQLVLPSTQRSVAGSPDMFCYSSVAWLPTLLLSETVARWYLQWW